MICTCECAAVVLATPNALRRETVDGKNIAPSFARLGSAWRVEAVMPESQVIVWIAHVADDAAPSSPPQSMLKFQIGGSPCDSVGRPAAAMLNQRGARGGKQEAI